MKKILLLITCVLFTMLTGGLSGVATASGVKDWYVGIEKPGFNPPNYIFGPVWSLLYLLMGISLFLILNTPNINKRKALILFAVQLTLNFFWSIIFFYLHQPGFAFVEIMVLWICILLMIIQFHKVNKAAALINIPYLLWVSFASVLNGSIWYLNR